MEPTKPEPSLQAFLALFTVGAGVLAFAGEGRFGGGLFERGAFTLCLALAFGAAGLASAASFGITVLWNSGVVLLRIKMH